MNNEVPKKCRSKGCNNSVLVGNYCEYHTKKKKEIRNGILGVAGTIILPGIIVAGKMVGPKIVKAAKPVAQAAIKIVFKG